MKGLSSDLGLVLAYNNVTWPAEPLILARSVDGGRHWMHDIVVEEQVVTVAPLLVSPAIIQSALIPRRAYMCYLNRNGTHPTVKMAVVDWPK